jgi:hypothetical protein
MICCAASTPPPYRLRSIFFCQVARKRKTSSRNWKTPRLKRAMGAPTTTPPYRTRRRKTQQKRITVTLATSKQRRRSMRQSSIKNMVAAVVRCHTTRRIPASRCTASHTKCTASSAPIRYSGKAPVQAGCPIRRRTSGCMQRLGNGRRCTTRYSTSFTTIREARAAQTKHF